MNLSVRDVTPDDHPFLREMLYEAAYWRPGDTRPPIDETLADPELAKLLAAWGREGDAGIIAVTPDAAPVGAAWYRLWTDSDHSYGYIDPETPELAIGVVAHARGQGIGRKLLQALIKRARRDGFRTLSLSVEKDNPALKLYESAGFEIVATVDNAWTMTLKQDSS